LGLSQKDFALRMNAPWPTFEKWLAPKESGNSREMPAIAWQLAREILEHEKLKMKCKQVNTSACEEPTANIAL